jgi:hypothetical protein
MGLVAQVWADAPKNEFRKAIQAIWPCFIALKFLFRFSEFSANRNSISHPQEGPGMRTHIVIPGRPEGPSPE